MSGWHMIIVLLFCTSLYLFGCAGWIQFKAVIAQYLLEYSWTRTVNHGDYLHHAGIKNSSTDRKSPINTLYKPWPWADIWPAARLQVPQYDIDQIVLAGDSGSSLAFGPGYSLASSPPGETGTTVISGHRDTHFSFLQKLKLNDTIILRSADKTQHYKVCDFKIVDSRSFKILHAYESNTLILVTCYPFDDVIPGSTLRYLVYATIINPATT
jgi:sortase A